MGVTSKKTVGNGNGFCIKQQPHLDQGVTCIMLAKTFAAKIILLINFEVVICYIVEDHVGLASVIDFDLLVQMKKKSLTKLGKVVQGPVNVVPITVKRTGHGFFLKEAGSFGPRGKYPCIH